MPSTHSQELNDNAVVLYVAGEAYWLDGGRLICDNVPLETVQVRPAAMAKLALIRAALETAETSLL